MYVCIILLLILFIIIIIIINGIPVALNEIQLEPLHCFLLSMSIFMEVFSIVIFRHVCRHCVGACVVMDFYFDHLVLNLAVSSSFLTNGPPYADTFINSGIVHKIYVMTYVLSHGF